MMDSQCAEMVSPRDRRGSFNRYRCSKKAGFGKDGLYCKMHAKWHPADDQETVTMYAARQKYNGFDLVVCEVYDVTDTSLVIRSEREIFGHRVLTGPTRFSAGDWQWFKTVREALLFIERAANGRVLSLRAEAVRMEQNLEPVRRMLGLEDLEQRVADAAAERTASIKKQLGWNEA